MYTPFEVPDFTHLRAWLKVELGRIANAIKGLEREQPVTLTAPVVSLQGIPGGSLIRFNYAVPTTILLPANLAPNWFVAWVQVGTGQVTFAGGALLENRQGHTKSAGQWATGRLFCDSNTSGSSAVVVLSGDTA